MSQPGLSSSPDYDSLETQEQSEQNNMDWETIGELYNYGQSLSREFKIAFGEDEPGLQILEMLLAEISEPEIYETLLSDSEGSISREKVEFYMDSIDYPEQVLQAISYLIPFEKLEKIREEMLNPEELSEQEFNDIIDIWALSVEAVYEDRVEQREVFAEYKRVMQEKREQCHERASEFVLENDLNANLIEPIGQLFFLGYSFRRTAALPHVGRYLIFSSQGKDGQINNFAYLLLDNGSILRDLPPVPAPQKRSDSPFEEQEEKGTEEAEFGPSEKKEELSFGEMMDIENLDEDNVKVFLEEVTEEERELGQRMVADFRDSLDNTSDEEALGMLDKRMGGVLDVMEEGQLGVLVEKGVFDDLAQAQRFYDKDYSAQDARRVLGNMMEQTSGAVGKIGVEMNISI